MAFEDFDKLFARKDKTLRELFEAKALAGWEFETFRGVVSENLKAGNLNLIIAVDEMNEQLEQIIAYLARRGIGIRLQAIELQIHTRGDVEILVPELYGELVPVPGGNTRGKIAWDYEKFFADAKIKLNSLELSALERLYEFSVQKARLTWGMGAKYGTFNVHVDTVSEKKSIFTVTSNGQIIINFGQLNENTTALEFRNRLKQQLEGIVGFEIPENYQEAWPIFPAKRWAVVVDEFIQVIDGLLADKTS